MKRLLKIMALKKVTATISLPMIRTTSKVPSYPATICSTIRGVSGGQKKDELIMRNREDDERSLQHRDDKHGEIKNDSGCIEAEEEKRKGVKEVLTAAEGEREGCGKGVKEVLTAPEGEREGREDIRNNGEIRSDTGRAEAKEEKGKRKRDKEVLIAAEGETERREDVLVTVEGKNQEKKER